MRKRTVQDPESQCAIPFDPTARAQEIRRLLRAKVETSVIEAVQQLMLRELQSYCGDPFAHKEDGQMWRGGSAPGSIFVNGQWIKIRRPRVRSRKGEKELQSYRAFRDRDVISDEVARMMLNGVSTRDYGRVFEPIAEGTRLGRAAVSEAFGYATQKHLSQINGRSLAEYKWAALFFDGIQFAGTTELVALGITETGEKLVLGLREGASENSEVCKDLIQSLVDRGLVFEGSILVVIDGSKALKKAIEAVWGRRALIARCRVHKMRNVLEYLGKPYHDEARRRINAAWSQNDYESAKSELLKTIRWLRSINESAANSLEEGIEETLTMHKLNLPEILRKSLATTNVIESALSIVRARTARVKNWRKGKGQVSRWTAAGLLIAEDRMNKIRGHKYLTLLVEKLRKKVETAEAVA